MHTAIISTSKAKPVSRLSSIARISRPDTSR
jgi:hypothetical protein